MTQGIQHSITDPSYPMVSITGEAPMFLNRYRTMPYKHYRSNPTAHISEKFSLQVSNLDNQPHQLTHRYTVDQVNGQQHYEYTGHRPITVAPLTYCHTDSASVGQLFSLDYGIDSTSYVIRQYISDDSCDPPLIDSMVYTQGFYNYFAYDNGIPELGFGVEPSPGGAFAVRFEFSELDTLRGVQILFNRTLNDANYQYFDIVVWKDNNGKPGDEVYRLTSCKPKWDEPIYKFAYYKFDRIVRLNGVFYVGIVQQGTGLLNVGFDTSRDNSQYNFINVTGSWQPSSKRGSIMFRPVVGTGYYIGVDENPIAESVEIHPNPASSTIHLRGIENGITYVIYDLTGRQVITGTYSDEIGICQLRDGLYFLSITTGDGRIVTKKFMVRQ